MGIIAVLAAVTTVSYRGVAKDAKLASAKNTLMVVLDNARALAIRNNRIVMVVFRPRMEETNRQVIEAVMCEFTGKGGAAAVSTPLADQIVESLVPMNGIPARSLPAGVKIAAPAYGASVDDVWITQSHFPAVGEVRGGIIGVMYAPDGTTITRNPASGAHRMYVDFNNNCVQEINGDVNDYYGCQPGWGGPPTINPTNFNGGYFEQGSVNDEPFVDVAAFLAVFDDDVVREQYDTNQWKPSVAGGAAAGNRQNNYTLFITNNADPIYFNRYTGVAMK